MIQDTQQNTTQNTNSVLMIRPSNFGYNPQTSTDNIFQNNTNLQNVNGLAQQEFDNLVKILQNNNVSVTVFQDEINSQTPDSIFLNNWFSTFGQRLVLYPMYAQNRRLERKKPLLDFLNKRYNHNSALDITKWEQDNKFLEGTGSMVIDHINKTILGCVSQRTNAKALEDFAQMVGYVAIGFEAKINGSPIYHTNVMMGIGTDWMVVCEEAITTGLEQVQKCYEGREVIKISLEQVDSFCGNIIELMDSKGQKIVVMSTKAYNSFSASQKSQFQKYTKIIHSDVSIIENVGGGGVRCMIAELF